MSYNYILITLLIILILSIIIFISFCIRLYQSYNQRSDIEPSNKQLGGEKHTSGDILTIYNCDRNDKIYKLYEKPMVMFELNTIKYHGLDYFVLKLMDVISEKIKFGNKQKEYIKQKFDSIHFENEKVKEITLYGEDFDEDREVSFNLMFANCKNLEKVTLDKSLEFVKINNLAGMFYNCPKLINISGLENLNVENVIDFGGMFRDCLSLESINFGSGFRPYNAKYMDEMFYNCPNLKSIKGFGKQYTGDSIISTNISYNCTSLQEMI